MKKALVLLSILLFSLLAFALPINAKVTYDSKTTFPWEMNSGVGRPYQDIRGFSARSNGTHLIFNVTLQEGPPKADSEHHVTIYIAIDVNNKTKKGLNIGSGDDGADWTPHESNSRYEPPLADNNYGGGHYYWEYAMCLYQWTTVKNWQLVSGSLSIKPANMSVTNSTDGTIVTAAIDLLSIKDPATKKIPTNVTLGVVTVESYMHDWSGEPNSYPYPTGAHISRDTIGNASFKLYNATWGQWLNVQPAIIGLLTSAGSWVSKTDPAGDFFVLPCNDMTKVVTGQMGDFVFINVTFANMTYMDLSGQWYMWTGRWQMAIAIDTDGVPGSGQPWFPPRSVTGDEGFRDVRIHPDNDTAYWERCIVVDEPSGTGSGHSNHVYLYDSSMTNLGSGGIVATYVPNATDKSGMISVKVPKGALALAMPRRLRLTIISGQNWANIIEDVIGTWSYSYAYANPYQSSEWSLGGCYLVRTCIEPTEEILPPWPGPKVPTPPSAIGRPYQDIRGVSARSDGTNLYVNVTLDQGPPKKDNETHVNIYVAIDNGTLGGSWKFPDEIDVGYGPPAENNPNFWEYCLALYRWTGLVPQRVNLTYITEYVIPPKTPKLVSVDALARGVTVTNSTDGKIVKITIPYTAFAKKPSSVTIGVVTSEDLAKVKDTVGSGYTRLSFSQWIEVSPAITSLSTALGSPVSASDPAGDFVGKSFWDITGVTVGMKNNIITVNATFQNVSCISWSMEQWGLSIGIDIDHIAGSGENLMWDPRLCQWDGWQHHGCDAQIDEAIKNAYWERCVVLDSPADIHLYDKDHIDWGSSGIWATLLEAENKVSVNIPNWILPPSPDRKLNLTILSYMDPYDTACDVYGSYVYAYSAENTQGFYNLTAAIKTGVVMYPWPAPTASFNTAMGRPYQDITGVWAKSDGTHLNVSVTLREAPLKGDNEAHINMYVAIDTKAGGQDWFPDSIDVRYNISKPDYFWEYCLAVYSWTGTTQSVDILNMTWHRTNALSNAIGNVTVTNSTDGRTVNMSIPLALIGNPSTVTLGTVTSEDGSKIKDTVGSGTAILVGWQWIQVEPWKIDLSTAAGSSASMSDPTWDFTGKSFWDITGVRVGADATDIIVNVTFLDVGDLATSWDHWWLSFGVDLDHVPGSGLYFAYAPGTGTDTTLANMSESCWELMVMVNSPDDISVWNITKAIVGWQKSTATWIGKAGVRASLNTAQNKVTVSIPKINVTSGHSWDYNLTVTVVCGTDAGNRVYDLYGTYTYAYKPGISEYGDFGCYHIKTDPSLNKTGPFKAELTMKRLYWATLNMDQWLGTTGDPKIVAKFYKYDRTYQGQTVLNTSITLPVRTHYYGDLDNPIATPPGYQDAPIEIMEVVLTDDAGNTILVIARLVYTRSVLFKRIVAIIIRWPFAPAGERITLFKELVDISKQWPYAP